MPPKAAQTQKREEILFSLLVAHFFTFFFVNSFHLKINKTHNRNIIFRMHHFSKPQFVFSIYLCLSLKISNVTSI